MWSWGSETRNMKGEPWHFSHPVTHTVLNVGSDKLWRSLVCQGSKSYPLIWIDFVSRRHLGPHTPVFLMIQTPSALCGSVDKVDFSFVWGNFQNYSPESPWEEEREVFSTKHCYRIYRIWFPKFLQTFKHWDLILRPGRCKMQNSSN